MSDQWQAVPLDVERFKRLLFLRKKLNLDANLAHLLSMDAEDLAEFLSIITDQSREKVIEDFSLQGAARALNGFLELDILGPYLALQIERGYKIHGEAG